MQDERHLDVRTLIIASIASAAAALITSQFWIRGTPIAAALTPIIVTLVSELLHKPTEKLAQRRTAAAEFKVYRSGSSRRKRIAWVTVLTTGLLAFAIAAVVLTVPELIAGGSIGGRDRATTLVPSKKKDRGADSQPAETVTEEQRTVTETVPSESETVTETTPVEPRTTPTTPAPQATPPTTTTPATPTAPAQ